jgi:hypothetical protein
LFQADSILAGEKCVAHVRLASVRSARCYARLRFFQSAREAGGRDSTADGNGQALPPEYFAQNYFSPPPESMRNHQQLVGEIQGLKEQMQDMQSYVLMMQSGGMSDRHSANTVEQKHSVFLLETKVKKMDDQDAPLFNIHLDEGESLEDTMAINPTDTPSAKKYDKQQKSLKSARAFSKN